MSLRTRESNLRNAVGRTQAYRLARGLYASNVGVYRDQVPNVMLVAAKAAPDAVLAYHSALEVHGVAHSRAKSVYFLSAGRNSPFDVRGYRFRRAPDLESRRAQPRQSDRSSRVTQVRTGDSLVWVTDRERTCVDCLYRLDLAGGLELLRGASGRSAPCRPRVAGYVCSLGSPTLVARVGWLLSLMREDWLVDSAPLDDLGRVLGRGTYWLQRRRPGARYDFVSEWRLYVPAGLSFLDWLRG